MTTTTIVSAFIANMNTHRNTSTYINYGLKFLLTPIYKIIFIDETLIEEIRTLIPDEYKQYLHIIPTKYEDCYLYEYIGQIQNFSNSGYSIKDTLNYMFVMNNKIDFVKKAIELNIFNSTQFVWVDFGIAHINKSEIYDTFFKSIVNLKNNIYNTVRIGSIWEPNQQREQYYIKEQNIYSQVAWIFAGGVFGGDIPSLLKFEKLCREMCLRVINEKGNIMWEVNIWFMVYLENKELFSLYSCDHNLSLIEKY